MQADLLSHFNTLEDPRIDRTKRYPLIEIIFLIIKGCIVTIDAGNAVTEVLLSYKK